MNINEIDKQNNIPGLVPIHNGGILQEMQMKAQAKSEAEKMNRQTQVKPKNPIPVAAPRG